MITGRHDEIIDKGSHDAIDVYAGHLSSLALCGCLRTMIFTQVTAVRNFGGPILSQATAQQCRISSIRRSTLAPLGLFWLAAAIAIAQPHAARTLPPCRGHAHIRMTRTATASEMSTFPVYIDEPFCVLVPLWLSPSLPGQSLAQSSVPWHPSRWNCQ